MHSLIERAGEVPFDTRIAAVLDVEADDLVVDIKPNGAIFVSHIHYRTVLDRAFGVGGWALIPLDKPKVQGNRAIYYGFLKARGVYIADAVGGCTYVPQNAEMSLDDAVEGAKSDCLTRCCKVLPMFRNLWDREYADYWKATYAEVGVTPQSRGRQVWKKKGEAMRGWNTRQDRMAESEYRRPPRVEDENNRHLREIAGKNKYAGSYSGEELPGDEFYDDARE